MWVNSLEAELASTEAVFFCKRQQGHWCRYWPLCVPDSHAQSGKRWVATPVGMLCVPSIKALYTHHPPHTHRHLAMQVDELLPGGASSIPQLSVALVTISRALDSEMAAMPAREVRMVQLS
jgi:hypothetical protein